PTRAPASLLCYGRDWATSPAGFGFLASLAVEAIFAVIDGAFADFAFVGRVLTQIDTCCLVHVLHAGVIPDADLRAVGGTLDLVLDLFNIVSTRDGEQQQHRERQSFAKHYRYS